MPDVADDLTVQLDGGRLTITHDAIAEIVAETALACYGVVALTAPTRVRRMLRREGVTVEGGREGLRIELHVVVEHGLNLAEVAATVRTRVAYEVEQRAGLHVAAVEVHVDAVRGSA